MKPQLLLLQQQKMSKQLFRFKLTATTNCMKMMHLKLEEKKNVTT